MKNWLKNILTGVTLLAFLSLGLIWGSKMISKDEAEKVRIKATPHTITLYSSGTQVGEWKGASSLYFSPNGRVDFTDTEGRRVSIHGEFVVVPERPQLTADSLPSDLCIR